MSSSNDSNAKEAFDLESMLTYRVSMLYSRLARTWRHIADDFGLSLREWRVLAALAKDGAATATDLVAQSPLDKASVSRAVATLEERGLVSSRQDRSDARVRKLSLTSAGRRVYQRVAPLSAERQRAILSVLTRAEREELFRSLDRLIARTTEFLDEPRAPSARPRRGRKPHREL